MTARLHTGVCIWNSALMCEIFPVEYNVIQLCEENVMSCFFIQHYPSVNYDPVLALAMIYQSGLTASLLFLLLCSIIYHS